MDDVPAVVSPDSTYPQYLTDIAFPASIPQGQTVHVVVQMAGKPSCPTSSFMCAQTPDETFFVAPTPGSAWYHSNPFALDPFVGSVEMKVPTGWIAAAGHGVGGVVARDASSETWLFELQAPVDLFGAYAASPSAASTMKSSSGFPVSAIYRPGDDAEDVTLALEVSSALLPLMESQFGELPIDEAKLVTLPKGFAAGAMSTLGIVYVNDVVFTTHDYLVEQGMAHELSHFWWGNLASAGKDNEAPFYGEGMAEFSGWKSLGVWRGPETRKSGMRMNAVWYMYRRPKDEDMAILTGNPDSPAFIYATYHKGALALRTIEAHVGPEVFEAALRRFATHGVGGLSTVQLIDDILTEGGPDVTALTDMWLRKKGYPVVTIAVARRAGGADLQVNVTGEYTLDLPIDVVAPDGSRSRTIAQVGSGDSTLSIEHEGEVASLEIDPDWTMAREIASALPEDVTMDGVVDGADLIEIALRHGTELPTVRRVDGGYDPLYDVDRDRVVGDADLDRVVAAAPPFRE